MEERIFKNDFIDESNKSNNIDIKFTIKDHGYTIFKINKDNPDDKTVMIITNDVVKEAYAKTFPWVRIKGKAWEEKKYFRDPTDKGVYWNYKNAKYALRMLIRMSKLSRRTSGKGYLDEFNKYSIERVNCPLLLDTKSNTVSENTIKIN